MTTLALFVALLLGSADADVRPIDLTEWRCITDGIAVQAGRLQKMRPGETCFDWSTIPESRNGEVTQGGIRVYSPPNYEWYGRAETLLHESDHPVWGDRVGDVIRYRLQPHEEWMIYSALNTPGARPEIRDPKQDIFGWTIEVEVGAGWFNYLANAAYVNAKGTPIRWESASILWYSGTVYYTDGGLGSDGNSCATAQSPDASAKATVTAGLGCLTTGDILEIANGTYSVSIVQDNGSVFPSGVSDGVRTIVRAENAMSTIFQEQSSGWIWVVRDTDYLTVDGIDFDGNLTSFIPVGSGGVTANQELNYYTIQNGSAHDVTQYPTGDPGWNCMAFGGHTTPNNTFIKVINNTLYNCGSSIADEFGNPQGHCLYPATVADGLMSGNTLYNCQSYGIHLYQEVGSGAAWGADTVTEKNSVFDIGEAALLSWYTDGSTWRNNAVWNTGVHVSGNGNGVDHWNSYNIQTIFNTFYTTPNCWFKNPSNSTGGTVGGNIAYLSTKALGDTGCNDGGATVSPANLEGDPTFTNAAMDDFTLQASSTAIDTVSCGSLTDDIDNNSRPQGSLCDQGAYEYVGGGGPPTSFIRPVYPSGMP